MGHISKYDAVDSISSIVYSDASFLLTVNQLCRYIFSTEGHLLPATPQITLLDEHCLYAGAFCNGTAGHGYGTGDSSNKHQNANSVPFDDSRTPSDQSLSNILSTTRGYIKVLSVAYLICGFFCTAFIGIIERKMESYGLHCPSDASDETYRLEMLTSNCQQTFRCCTELIRFAMQHEL